MSVTGTLEKTVFNVLTHLPRGIRKIACNAAGKYRTSRALSLSSPDVVTFYVTSRCNARCRHCFYINKIEAPQSDLLDLDSIKKICNSFPRPIKTLMITGGEPFLRKDLEQIVDCFFRLNKTKRITLATNGFLGDTAERVFRMASDHPDNTIHCQISIDGPEKIHDFLRNYSGGYRKAIKTLTGLIEYSKQARNIDISVMTTVSEENFECAESFAQYMAQSFPEALHKFNILRGAHEGCWGLPESCSSNLDFDGEKVKSVDKEKLVPLLDSIRAISNQHDDILWQRFQFLKWEYILKILKGPSKEKRLFCPAGYNYGVIFEDGSVSLCENALAPVNLCDYGYDFSKTWHSAEMNALRENTRSCQCTHPCNVLDSLSCDGDYLFKATTATTEGKG